VVLESPDQFALPYVATAPAAGPLQ
jgi:hypothetical protein